MSEAVQKPDRQNPEGYSPKERPEILSLAEDARQIEKPVQIIKYKSVDFEVVRRSDVIWVGCVDYAANNTDESNIQETLKRFQGLVETAPIREKVNPDWSASLSINYNCSDKPCGIMFANESYTDQQDERYDIFTQPGGLWLRVKGDDKNAKALLGKDKAQLYEFFEPLRNAAKENGYVQNPDVPVEVEYHCHAEYATPPHTCYAYIPVIESPEGYSPKERPEILSLAEQVQSGSQQLPPEFILTPKDRIAKFSGEKWPYSNTEPAIYAALGLFYGRTERRDDSGALVNDDVEYAVHNVLTGHAFGLFYCLPDDSLSMAAYGFSSSHPDIRSCSEEEIMALIKTQIYSGNAVYIDEGNGRFDYLIWGYKDSGNRLLGYKFEHGNDGLNCSFDFDNPAEFDSLIKSFSDPALYQKNGEKTGGITFICPEGDRTDRDRIYKQALTEGVQMLTQTEPAPAMDFEKVHFGYGQAIYDEWIRQIEQADAEEREPFFDTFPIFPHFIALYENRLQLLRFLKNWNERLNNEELNKVLSLCEKLHQITGDAATVSVPVKWNRLKDAPNHQKRVFVLERLKECRALELEIADALSVFLEKTKE